MCAGRYSKLSGERLEEETGRRDAHPEDGAEQERTHSGLAHPAYIGGESDAGERNGDQRERRIGEHTPRVRSDQSRRVESRCEHEEREKARHEAPWPRAGLTPPPRGEAEHDR